MTNDEGDGYGPMSEVPAYFPVKLWHEGGVVSDTDGNSRAMIRLRMIDGEGQRLIVMLAAELARPLLDVLPWLLLTGEEGAITEEEEKKRERGD